MNARDETDRAAAFRHWRLAYDDQTTSLRPKALTVQAAELFQGIQKLDLSICKCDAGFIRQLGRFSHVRGLTLRQTEGLNLSAFHQLRELVLEGDADLAALKDIVTLPALESLTISNWKSFDETLQGVLSSASLTLKKLHVDKDLTAPCWSSPNNQARLSCQALHRLTNLQSVSLGFLADCSYQSISGLLVLTALRSLSFANSGCLDSRGMRTLAELSSLSELHILDGRRCRSFGASLTSDDAAHLAGLRNLHSLTVNGCWWDKGISALSKMSQLTKLTNLDISHSAPSLVRSVLSAFPLENLEVLVMRHSKCFPDDLLPLQRATRLQSLDIYSCLTQNAALGSSERVLQGLSELRSLSISCSYISPASPVNVLAANLGRLTSLEWPNEAAFLWASCCLDSESQGRIAALLQQADELTSLQRLCIREHSLAPAATTLSNLGRITTLTELDLSRTFCEEGVDMDNLIGPLGSLTSLAKLSLASTAVRKQGFKTLAGLQELTSLDLSCLALEDGSLSCIACLPKLRELFLDSWNLENCISDADLAHVGAVHSLERISMRSNWHVTNAGLSHLLHLPRLALLDLRGCLHVHAETALRQFQNCTSLTELLLSEPGDLSAYSAVSAAELAALHSRLPYLRSVMLGGQVMTNRAACAILRMQHKLRLAALEVAKACLIIMQVYESAVSKRSVIIGAIGSMIRQPRLDSSGTAGVGER